MSFLLAWPATAAAADPHEEEDEPQMEAPAEEEPARAAAPPPATAPPPVAAAAVPGHGVEVTAAPVHQNFISANPVALLFGFFNLEYERAVGSGMSFFVGPSFAFASADDLSLMAFGLNGGVRFFLSAKPAPTGLWVSPQLGLAVATASSGDATATAGAFSAGGLIGYTWLWDAFGLSLGIGAQFTNMAVEVDGETIGASGIGPAARLSLGYAF